MWIAVIAGAAALGMALAAKRTGDLIPMCHPLGLDHVEIRFEALSDDVLEIRCQARCRVTSRAWKKIRPEVGAMRPLIKLTKVVLPAPLGPIMARISP